MPEREQRRKRYITIAGLAIAFVLVGCVGMAVGGGLVFGLTQFTDLMDRNEDHRVVSAEIDMERDGIVVLSQGALISEVLRGSPAQDAGLEEGDIILSVEGERVGPATSLGDLLANYEPGDRVAMQIQRPGKGEIKLKVRLGEHPDKEGAAYLGVRYATHGAAPLRMEEWLPERPLDRFDLPFMLPEGGRISGVLVQEVTEGSPADKAGLSAGDIIESVDDEPVEDPEHLADLVGRREPGDTIRLSVREAETGDQRQVRVTLGAHPEDSGRGYLGVSVGGAVRIDGFFEEGEPGRLEFYYEGPRNRGEPFDPRELPFFHREGWPFDLEDLDHLPFWDRDSFEEHEGALQQSAAC
jgi:hypothetical protein